MMSWSVNLFLFPASKLMEQIIFLNDYVMMYLISILFMVMFFMSQSLTTFDFNSNFSENHELEFIWTVLPFFVILAIAIPSLFTLYISDSCIFCGLNMNVLGHQWYWTYSYKNFLGLVFDSYMNENMCPRLLDVDNRIILPMNLPIQMTCSSEDVIHSWCVPSLGIKMDAMPGRLNQFCFSINRMGVFFGQCSEICGVNHSFMPIVIESIKFFDFFNMLKD